MEHSANVDQSSVMFYLPEHKLDTLVNVSRKISQATRKAVELIKLVINIVTVLMHTVLILEWPRRTKLGELLRALVDTL